MKNALYLLLALFINGCAYIEPYFAEKQAVQLESSSDWQPVNSAYMKSEIVKSIKSH